MSFEIQYASPADAEELTDVFMTAFSSPFDKKMLPSTPDVRAWTMKNLFSRSSDAAECEVLLKMVDTSESNKIVALAKWIRPFDASADQARQSSASMDPWPESADVALCEAFFGAMDEYHRRLMGDRPHYCT